MTHATERLEYRLMYGPLEDCERYIAEHEEAESEEERFLTARCRLRLSLSRFVQALNDPPENRINLTVHAAPYLRYHMALEPLNEGALAAIERVFRDG